MVLSGLALFGFGCGDSGAPTAEQNTAGSASSAAGMGTSGQAPAGGSASGVAGNAPQGGTDGRAGAAAGGGGASAAAAGTAGAAPGGAGGGNEGGSSEGGAGSSPGGGNSGSNLGGGGNSGRGGNGGAGAGSGGMAPLVAVTVYLAGDSTVSTYADTASPGDQAGWGQMLPEYLDPLAKVDNRAIGGRTARRFIDEGHLKELSDDLKAGDFLLVQFGTNDSNKTATYTLNGQTIPYYLDPGTDFKTYLKAYISAARAKQASPVLVTPPPRNSAYCTGGNGTGAYAQAMRELGAAEQVAVADLNERAVTYLKAICPAPTPENFFLLRADGTVDGTHFQEKGARKLASFVTQGFSDTPTTLARYVK
jgi:lysophospholipase L1-like esterase